MLIATSQNYPTKIERESSFEQPTKPIKTNLKTVLFIGQQLNLTFEIFHLFVIFT